MCGCPRLPDWYKLAEYLKGKWRIYSCVRGKGILLFCVHRRIVVSEKKIRTIYRWYKPYPPPPPTHTHTHTRARAHTQARTHAPMNAICKQLKQIMSKGLRRRKKWRVRGKHGRSTVDKTTTNVSRSDLKESREGYFRRGRGRSFNADEPDITFVVD